MFSLKILSSKSNFCTIILSILFSEWWLYQRFFEAHVYVSGYGWANSLRHAWAVSSGQGQHWDYFREPLHGFLVGTIGFLIEDFGGAGVLVSSICVQIILFCNALTVATLCSKRKNKAISIAIAIVFTTLSLPYASLWSNGYPFACLGFSLLTLTSVRYVQFPSTQNYILLMMGISFALCTDSRLWGFLGIPMLSILYTVFYQKQKQKHSNLMFLFLIVPMLFPSFLKQQLGSRAEYEISLLKKREYQQEVALRWVRITRDTRMKQMCSDQTVEDFWTISFWNTPCSRAVVSDNLYRRFQARIPITMQSFLVVFIVVLVLMRKNKSIWILLIGYGLPLWGLAASTPFAVRYTLFIVPFASIWLPCLFGCMPLRHSIVWLLAFLQCSSMILFHQRNEYLGYVREQGILDSFVIEIQTKIDIDHEGHLLRDCSETGITKTLLPFSIEGKIPAHRQDIDDACDGENWTEEILVFDLHRKHPPSQVIEQGKNIFHMQGYEVWRKP